MAVATSNPAVSGPFALVQTALGSMSLGRRKTATVAAGALALAVGYHVIFGANGLTMYEHKRAETRELQQRMQTLQQENQRLQQQVERLKSDPDAIEQQAREQLHYTKAGEVIYTLPSK
jgi:cell division protein FtsB